jgi:glutamine amidotransferase
MQSSEEGSEKGLGWIEGQVVRFKRSMLPSEYKVPHMSWTDVDPRNGQALYKNIEDPRFYFVHSYHLETDPEFVTATAEYGYRFIASVQKSNIQGVQFHPEKSHKFGLQLYSNFQNYF